MKKFWLNNSGKPTDAGDSHLTTAKAILRIDAKDTRPDYDFYCLMYDAGWVRVVSMPDKLYGERHLSRRQAPFGCLPKAQRHWLEDNSALVGKQLIWNDAVFESTREGRSNASRAAQVLMAG